MSDGQKLARTRLIEAIEGECDGLGITEMQAENILAYVQHGAPMPVCCGRPECGGECGHEWGGMELVAQPEVDFAKPVLLNLLREARAALEVWKDVAPAVSLCADIDSALAQGAALTEPEWIDDPHDIEQGMMRNPKYVAPSAPQPSAQALTDEQIEAIWQATPTDGIHYIFGEPAKELRIRFARALLAAEQTSEDKRDGEAYRRINTPEIDGFIAGLRNEMLHQRERHGATGDAGKTDADWFWLVGYLAGKAIRPGIPKEKLLHHIITTAAALGNWHGARTGHYVDMRPGIAGPYPAHGEPGALEQGEPA